MPLEGQESQSFSGMQRCHIPWMKNHGLWHHSVSPWVLTFIFHISWQKRERQNVLFASKSFTVWSKQDNLFWHHPRNKAEIIPFVNNMLSEKNKIKLLLCPICCFLKGQMVERIQRKGLNFSSYISCTSASKSNTSVNNCVWGLIRADELGLQSNLPVLFCW